MPHPRSLRTRCPGARKPQPKCQRVQKDTCPCKHSQAKQVENNASVTFRSSLTHVLAAACTPTSQPLPLCPTRTYEQPVLCYRKNLNQDTHAYTSAPHFAKTSSTCPVELQTQLFCQPLCGLEGFGSFGLVVCCRILIVNAVSHCLTYELQSEASKATPTCRLKSSDFGQVFGQVGKLKTTFQHASATAD